MSDYFKTPKGTELPLLSLKGKLYLEVRFRIQWMREEHPDWCILTEPVTLNDTYALFKATILDGNGKMHATAHGREDFKHFPDPYEKAESKAIGRALGFCGYGTQFAPELQEEDRIVDSPVSPKKTQPQAIKTKVEPVVTSTPVSTSKDKPYTVPFGKFKGMELSIIPDSAIMDYMSYIEEKAKADNKPLTGQVLEFMNNATAYLNDQLLMLLLT